MTTPLHDGAPLSAAEALVLQDPNRNQGRAGFKLTLMELLARKLITLRHEERPDRFGRVHKTDYLVVRPDAQTSASNRPDFQSVLTTVGQAGTKGADATVDQVVQSARKVFGADLSKFQSIHIIPALTNRGLIEQYTAKRLVVFSTTRYRHTAAGEALKQQIEGQLNQARSLPTLVDQDPASAVALVATLGSMVLLVDDLKPHYGRISQALRVTDSDTGYIYVGDVDNNDSRDFDGFDTSLGNSFDFDLSAFDTLDSSLDAFESSFDSADSGSDGGGDSSDSGGGGD